MIENESIIQYHEKLTSFFGGWPSFHDAEIIELHCWRGNVRPGAWDDRNIFPILTVKLQILQATQEHPSYTNLPPDILVTLRFYDVDNFKMHGFNHINQITDFTVIIEERGFFTNGDKLPPYLVVAFEAGFGMIASFRCFKIEVLDATPIAETEE